MSMKATLSGRILATTKNSDPNEKKVILLFETQMKGASRETG